MIFRYISGEQLDHGATLDMTMKAESLKQHLTVIQRIEDKVRILCTMVGGIKPATTSRVQGGLVFNRLGRVSQL